MTHSDEFIFNYSLWTCSLRNSSNSTISGSPSLPGIPCCVSLVYHVEPFLFVLDWWRAILTQWNLSLSELSFRRGTEKTGLTSLLSWSHWTDVMEAQALFWAGTHTLSRVFSGPDPPAAGVLTVGASGLPRGRHLVLYSDVGEFLRGTREASARPGSSWHESRGL